MAPWSYWSAPNPGLSMRTLADQLAKQDKLIQQLVGQGNVRRGQGNGHENGKPVQGSTGGAGNAAAGGKKAKAKWLCLLKACTKSANGAMNNANKTQCFGCGNAKGYCCSPPAALCRTTAQDKVAEAKGAKAAAGNDQQPKAKAKAKPEPTEAAKEEEQALLAELPAVPSPPAISDFVKGRVAPPVAVVVKTAEECLLGVAPKDRAHDLAQARDDLAHWQAALDSAQKGATGSARLKQVPTIKEELQKAQVLATKLEQDAPVTACTVTLLEKSMSDYKHTTTLRTESWKKGAAKAKASEEEVFAAIDEHIAEWQALRLAITKDAATRTAAWVEHHEKVLETMDKVATTLKTRHDAAVAATSTDGASAPAAVAVPAQEPQATPMQEDSMEEFKHHDDHWLPVLYAPSELPDHKEALKKTSPVSKGAMTKMWGVVHAWPMYSSTQLTYVQFGASTDEGFITMKALVGPVIWKRMYGERADKILHTDVCPRAFATPMLVALSLASSQLAEQSVCETAIAKCSADIKELGVETVAKRRRAA